MELRLSDSESRLLVEILEDRHRNLIHEIAHTDHREFKHELQDSCKMLEGILQRMKGREAATE